MAEEFSPNWEYWTPDPEIAEVMGNYKPQGFDGIMLVREDGTPGRMLFEGYRFAADLQSGGIYEPYQKDYWDEIPPKVRGWNFRTCIHCKELFRIKRMHGKKTPKCCGIDCRDKHQKLRGIGCDKKYKLRRMRKRMGRPRNRIDRESFVKAVKEDKSLKELSTMFGISTFTCAKIRKIVWQLNL